MASRMAAPTSRFDKRMLTWLSAVSILFIATMISAFRVSQGQGGMGSLIVWAVTIVVGTVIFPVWIVRIGWQETGSDHADHAEEA